MIRRIRTSLFAALWDFRRKGWTFRSGGESAERAIRQRPVPLGRWRHVRGPKSPTPANKGFPKKPFGRIAVAVAPSASNIVYAFVESTDSALFRSDDGGKTWDKRDKSQLMVWRPFYFANLIVDPKNPDRLFKPDLNLIQSLDGGKSFANVGGGTPRRSSRRVDRSDRHAARDHRRRRRPVAVVRWRQQVVEAEQSAGVAVLSRERRRGRSVPRLRRPAGQQLLGRRQRVSRRHHATRAGKTCTAATASGCSRIRPTPTTSTPKPRAARSAASIATRTSCAAIQPEANYNEKLRWNWNTPIALSPNEKGTIYIGAQFLFRSRDHGQSWDRISPDLTTNDPQKQKQEESGGVTVDNSAAEMHTTIYSISESPKQAGPDLGRHRRRQRAAHARRRQELEQRRAQHQGRAGACVGVVGAGRQLRRRHRVRRVRPPHVRRHGAVHLRDDRFRQDLDARWFRRRTPRACAATRT